jgi:hypothetical protein
MLFFTVRGPDLWGDHGRILAGGIVRRSDMESKPNLLLRTGPFIPPISFPFRHVVVTEESRSKFVQSDLGNFAFRDIEKFRIRKLHWELWDRSADVPEQYPRGGEPERYIYGGWHSRAAAKAMGPIWELVLPESAITAGVRILREGRRKPGERIWDVMVDIDTWLGDHFFRSINKGHIIASEVGADWLSSHFREWLSLTECIPWDPGKLNAEQ